MKRLAVLLLLWAVGLACGGATTPPGTALETRMTPEVTGSATPTPTTKGVLPQASPIPETPEAHEPAVTPTPKSVGTPDPAPSVTVPPPTRVELPQATPTMETPQAFEPSATPAPETTTAPEPTSTVAVAPTTESELPQATPIVETPEAYGQQPPVGEDPGASGPVVRIGSAEFAVELAITPSERAQGLSDRPHLAPDTGMLFIYQQQSRYSFWMRDMHFALDILWISKNCIVADVSLNVPPPEPGQTTAQLPRYSPAVPVQYVLEINAGEATAKGIMPGASVEFTGDLAGQFGC